MTPLLFWLIVVLGLVLPLAHVALSPRSGSWLPPRGTLCPLGPRVGWIVMVLFLGPIGWLVYMRARARRGAAARPGDRGRLGAASAPPRT